MPIRSKVAQDVGRLTTVSNVCPHQQRRRRRQQQRIGGTKRRICQEEIRDRRTRKDKSVFKTTSYLRNRGSELRSEICTHFASNKFQIYLCYAEIKHSDWLKIVVGLGTANQSA